MPQDNIKPTGYNGSATQPYAPAQRTTQIGLLPNAYLTLPNDLMIIQTNGITSQITVDNLRKSFFENYAVQSVNGMTGQVKVGVNNLDDTKITNPNPKDVLYYNGYQWINLPLQDNLTLNNMSDVSVTTPTPNNDILGWNSRLNKWTNVAYDPTQGLASMLWTPCENVSGFFVSSYTLGTVTSFTTKAKGLYYSNNGIDLQQTNITTGNWYSVIQFGDKLYTAGSTGVLSSTNGITWTQTSETDPSCRVDMASTKKMVIIQSNGVSVMDTNGTVTKPISSGEYATSMYSGTSWLVGGTNTLAYSTNDAVSFTSIPFTGFIRDIEVFNGQWLLATSVGLFSMTTVSGTYFKIKDGDFTHVVNSAGLTLALSTGNKPIWTTNGVTWNTALNGNNLQYAMFGNGYWVAGGSDSGLWWSIDGNEWALSNQTTGTLVSASYSGTTFFALTTTGVLWSNNTVGKVLSVNGQTGVVSIALADLYGTNLANAQNNNVMTYSDSKWIPSNSLSINTLTVTDNAVFGKDVTINGNINIPNGLAILNMLTTTQVLGAFTPDLNEYSFMASAYDDNSLNKGGQFRLYPTINDDWNMGALRYYTDETTQEHIDLLFDGQKIQYKGSEIVNQDMLSGLFPTEALPNNANLDDYIKTGGFTQNTTPTGENFPILEVGTLQVIGAGGVVSQQYITSEDMYTRRTFNTEWSDWVATVSTDSPNFTGTPTAPTAIVGTDTDQIATTKFVVQSMTHAGNYYPNLISAGSDVNTSLTYTGTGGFILTKGPLVANSDKPSTFLYRPRVTINTTNQTDSNYFALIGDITNGTLLDAKFKSIISAGNISAYSLTVTNTLQVKSVTAPTVNTTNIVTSDIVTLSTNAIRIKNSTAPDPAVIQRNDGNNFWLLLTNSNQPDGDYNALRPFSIKLTNGLVTMGNGLNVTNSINTDALTVTNSANLPANTHGVTPATADKSTLLATTAYVCGAIDAYAIRNYSFAPLVMQGEPTYQETSGTNFPGDYKGHNTTGGVVWWGNGNVNATATTACSGTASFSISTYQVGNTITVECFFTGTRWNNSNNGGSAQGEVGGIVTFNALDIILPNGQSLITIWMASGGVPAVTTQGNHIVGTFTPKYGTPSTPLSIHCVAEYTNPNGGFNSGFTQIMILNIQTQAVTLSEEPLTLRRKALYEIVSRLAQKTHLYHDAVNDTYFYLQDGILVQIALPV